jgi:hypothetical protein
MTLTAAAVHRNGVQLILMLTYWHYVFHVTDVTIRMVIYR